MNNLFLYLLFITIGVLGMYLMYKPQINKYEQTLNLSYLVLPLPYIYGLYALGSLVAYFISENTDFIETLTFTRMIVPLILAPVVYAAGIFLSERMAFVTTIACVALTVWLQPIGDGNSYPEIPVWSLRLLIFIFASIYCLGGIVQNFLPHTLLVPKMVFLFGLIMMAIFGACPAYAALSAAVLLGALGGYLSINFYEVKIEIDDAAAIAISYMVCSLLLLNVGELCLPSCIILTSVFWAELIVALCRRYFIIRAGSLAESTNYYAAAQVLTVKGLTQGMLKICGIMMFISWFQLYSVNGYSLLIVSLLVALWLNNSISLPNGGKQTLKEINQNFVTDLKQNISEAKEALNRGRKDDE